MNVQRPKRFAAAFLNVSILQGTAADHMWRINTSIIYQSEQTSTFTSVVKTHFTVNTIKYKFETFDGVLFFF